jgi:Zn-dependent M28 family amino/carboxypeptidase
VHAQERNRHPSLQANPKDTSSPAGYPVGSPNAPIRCAVRCVFVISLWLTSGCASVGQTGGESGLGEGTSVEDRLRADVTELSVGFADRNATNRDSLNESGEWVARRFESIGYSVVYEYQNVDDPDRGFNVIAELVGTAYPDEIIVIGAHYDTEINTPGADDNASGVAVMLELAARFVDEPQERTIRWIGFTNEENSNSRGGVMGSFTSAKNSKGRNENIVAMMSLEMLGYFSDEPDSQRYPFSQEMAARLGMELPTTGDFVGIVGRLEDRVLVNDLGNSMGSAGTINVTPAAIPAMVRAIWRSDHGNYWLNGYQAVMITDTSEYRTPHYHKESDTVETLNFEMMAGTVDALVYGVRELGKGE